MNLRLRVLGRRPDGYHDLDTLFQAIDLADEVGVALDGNGIRLAVHGPDLGAAADNLAYRAAARLAERAGCRSGIEVELIKHIPAGAGLGGGSSDAAAVLRCLGELLGIPEDDGRVRDIAVELGSDVPFFLGGSALARAGGRGTLLEPLPPLPQADLVVVSPPVHVATREAYAALSESRRGRAFNPSSPPSSPRDWEQVADQACNDFEAVVPRAHPEIARALDALTKAGAGVALMSGSGSSVFGLFPSRAGAEQVAAELMKELGWPCRPVRTLNAMPAPSVE